MKRAVKFLLIFFVILECLDKAAAQCSCGQFGYCDASGIKCICKIGWFNNNGVCEPYEAVVPRQISAAQASLATYYALICVVGIATFILFLKNSRAGLNVSSVIVIIIIVQSLVTAITIGVDPFMSKGIFPPLLRDLLMMVVLNGQLVIYLVIVIHWIELHHELVSTIKQEEMLSKINKNYQSKKTVQDIEDELRVIRKGRIPFIIITSVAFLIDFIAAMLNAFIPGNAATRVAQVWAFYFLAAIITIFIAFLVIAKKFKQVMPTRLYKRMRRATRRIAIISAVTGISEFVGLLTSVFQLPPPAFVAVIVISFLLIGFLPIIMLSTFWIENKFFSLKNLPIVGGWIASEDSHSASATTQDSGKTPSGENTFSAIPPA